MCVYMIFYYIIQSGYSFLHPCSYMGHTDVCSFLISRGANINQVDRVSIVFHYSCVTTDNIYIGYISSGKDVRPVISCGKNSASVKLRKSGGFMKALLFHEVYNRCYISDRR